MDTFRSVGQPELVAAIEAATVRVVLVAPGVSLGVAHAIASAWARLGVGNVSVTLDADSEVYRLGYGETEGLELLTIASTNCRAILCHQPGVRIGILVTDDETLIYAPVPELVEAGERNPSNPNGVWLGSVPSSIADAVGVGSSGTLRQTIGLDHVPKEDLRAVIKDIKDDPPVPFDIARKVRVFTSYLEFVELEIRGCELSRKEIPLPQELFNSLSEHTRRRVSSRYKLVEKGDAIIAGEDELKEARKELERRFLKPLSGYGMALLRREKDAFEAGVEKLKTMQATFADKVTGLLYARVDEAIEELTKQFISGLGEQFPKEWEGALEWQCGDKEAVISEELRKAFGTVESHVGEMRVRVIYKGVTYETLTDDNFEKTVQKAFPKLSKSFDEFDAARAKEM